VLQAIKTLLWYPLPFSSINELKTFLIDTNTQWFNQDLFEKDFYLTIILHRISREIPEINFKGWTCLNKIYFPYFRLSEDLDFSLSTENPLVESNTKRANFAKEFREKIKRLTDTMWRTLNPDKYHHKKAQGNETLKKKEYTYLKYVLSYPSIYDQSTQIIKIELTYTHKQYFPSVEKPIQSLFIDPLTEESIFQPRTIACFDIQEMVAEKCRACLTRRTPAIRDFFDLWFLQLQWINILANTDIIKAKCDEVSDRQRALHDNYNNLEKQIKKYLHPVVNDLYSFDLQQIYDQIIQLQQELYTHESI